MKKSTLKVAMAAIAVCSVANAADAGKSNYYVGLEVGRAWTQNAGMKNDGTAVDGNMLQGGEINELGKARSIGLSLGKKVKDNVRVELAINHRSGFELSGQDAVGTIYSGDLKSDTVMANGYYSMPFGKLAPYVGAGIGLAKNKIDSLNYMSGVDTGTGPGGDETGFAWQVMAGLDYAVTSNVTLDLGYKYADLGTVITDRGTNYISTTPGVPYDVAGIKGDLTIQEVKFGVRYSF